MMGLAEEVGQIKKGFQADLIILDSNPLDDIMVLVRADTEVKAVFRAGRLCRDDGVLFGGGLLDRWARS